MTTQTRPPLIISIQSQVVLGHVGNSAAVFPMQAAGLEVAAIPTVLFSNTPHYPTLRGAAVPADLFADLLLGAQERELPQRASWIMTGYIGSVEVAELTADFIARAKQANPDLRYLCDPVMGDHAPGLYVPPEIAAVMRDRLLPMAELATPNAFELAYLTDLPVTSLPQLEEAARHLRLAEKGITVATGCVLADTPRDMLETIICEGSHTLRQRTALQPVALPGTGDLFAALVMAGISRGRDLPTAVGKAQDLTAGALSHAAQIGAGEVVLSDPGFRQALLQL
ncbi:pyridoxal kinase [Paracoccus seriniphilus]|uniref:pyridoxal kinase n=1 Tax=Paracoccus seriniphilus TaxID=184748 RepID=A0A239Q1J7_9RHOB|nr:pyridoxal kinase [Paracoccus seriniphilus]WCR15063.1 pyridoxal kinase [Paracoccus seriniphilus]SNT76126.1 Pyridoxal kinase [Paracoccus seriniphilus]